MRPTAQNCVTPKAAKCFFEHWLNHNSINFNWFETPKGTIHINKEKENYNIKNPINDKWFCVHDRRSFIVEMSELLSICFRNKS